MENIGEVIEEWLAGWNECSICHHMCDVGNIICTEDKCHICLDCIHTTNPS